MSNKLALIAKDFTPEKVDLIKRTVALSATDDELELFLYQAQRTGLDPLARQIVFNKFNTKNGPKVSIITSIDGYRLLADRTGKYAGNDDPIFEGEPAPIKASVTVYKLVSGIRCPFTATARWSEYCPSDGKDFMWKKMPHLMLGKCAEALALRKAFPAELSGLYTDTEMEQAGYVEGSYTEEPTKQPEQPKKAEAPKTNGNGKPTQKAPAPTTGEELLALVNNHVLVPYNDPYHLRNAIRLELHNNKWDFPAPDNREGWEEAYKLSKKHAEGKTTEKAPAEEELDF